MRTCTPDTPIRIGRHLRSLLAISIAAATAILGFGALTSPVATTATASTPTAATFNLFIPGTWETDDAADPTSATGMLEPVANRIAADHGAGAVVYFLPYMARAFDNGQSYATSKSTAVANASQILREHAAVHPGASYTITGYSQGADAAGDLAAAIGHGDGPVTADRVRAVALLADPRSGTDGEQTVGPTSTGTGIADPRPQGMGALAGKVITICHPDDLYCSIDKDRNPVLGQIGSALGTTTEETESALTRTADAMSTLASLDMAGIADNADRLRESLVAGDLRAAHQISGTLNNQLRPLVTLAAAIDYGTVADVLTVIPDETGMTTAAAALARILDRVDIERTADVVGRIQELSWYVLGRLTPSDAVLTTPDVTTSAGDVVDITRELGSLANDFVTGRSAGPSGTPLVSTELTDAASALARVIAAHAIADPAAVITDAVTAADFAASDAHVDYRSFVVDDHGTTALDWIGTWLSSRIDET
ncbi:cutinase family protein [Gordonia polyisoprenivorans]|nr:cutinase family protein [Gordonia polyisoprenivorans]UZF58117.1 cutinase family protein [Gordonia polyisoprenivorans]